MKEGHVEQLKPLSPKSKGKHAITDPEKADASLQCHVASNTQIIIHDKKAQGDDKWQQGKEDQIDDILAKANLNANCKDNFNGNKIPIPIYSNSDKEDKMEEENIDFDEDLDDELEREIEIEMENMWNPQGEWEGEINGEDEESNKIMENEKVNVLTGSPTKETEDSLKKIKGYGDTNKESNVLQEEESVPCDNQALASPMENQIISSTNSKEQTPPTPGPDPALDFSKYKWRHIHGTWNYMSDSAWESIVKGTEETLKEPTKELGMETQIIAAKKSGRPQKQTEPEHPKDALNKYNIGPFSGFHRKADHSTVMAARSALVAASALARSSFRSPAPNLIPRRGLAGGGDHHGPPKINFWEDPLSPSKWKEEHFVLVSLSGWGLLIYGGYKIFGGKKEKNEEVVAANH
ncbi:hypothetical protein J5N97_016859 [Dioscorea zingiberensis]|uniref:Uncharacterized protein n=1 Tax=Dioscorea zingiberensis TaxID=325984 RepID=A0A9D5CKZ9_9LILI|nr:hypothetical protein J5N97_016859 [Dioscorea zingiberensis]